MGEGIGAGLPICPKQLPIPKGPSFPFWVGTKPKAMLALFLIQDFLLNDNAFLGGSKMTMIVDYFFFHELDI